jgi:hypothetical protein
MQPTLTPPRRVFVDTQGWAEIFHQPALHHIQALQVMQHARDDAWELITTNLILSELVPLFRSRHFRLPQPQVLTIITQIRALPNLTLLHVDKQADQQAWGCCTVMLSSRGRTWMPLAWCSCVSSASQISSLPTVISLRLALSCSCDELPVMSQSAGAPVVSRSPRS